MKDQYPEMAIVLRAISIPGLSDRLASHFIHIAGGSFGAILLSGVGALLVSEQRTDFRLPRIISITWIFVNSAILTTLFLAV